MIFLDYQITCNFTSSKGKLSSISHHIGFVQNDQFHIAIAIQIIRYPESAFVSANFFISSRTTLIPRSSLAFNSITILLKSFPYIYLATAMIVDVFPVPGGPQKSKFGKLLSSMKVRTKSYNSYMSLVQIREKSNHLAGQVDISRPMAYFRSNPLVFLNKVFHFPFFVGSAYAPANIIWCESMLIISHYYHHPIKQQKMKKHMMDHSRLWDYDLLEELGKGEYGSVYKVHNKKNNRIYALKKINISSCHEKQKVQAFREIKALKLIKHPDIIEYFESFLSVDNIYIVMQYASKGDFSKIIKERRQKEKSFTQLELWQIFSTISNGLKYLHENKIVHRDLKLENIFMTESGKVKIGDLGMCKVMNSQSDLISTRVGTPLYFAPEIIQHRLYSFPVDVWALGCVFYNLTTLEHPFKEATIETLAYHVIEKDIKPIKGHYSGSLINLITDLLNKNVKKRPSIFEVNILLKQLKDNQIINKVVIFNAKKLAIMKNQLEQLEKQLKNNKQKKKERNEMEDSIQAPKVSKYNQSTPKKSETPRNPQYFYKQSRSNSFNKFSSTVNDWSKIKKKETAYCGMIKTNGFSLATSMVIPQKQQEINYFNSQFFAQKQNRKSFETYRKNFKRQHCN